MFTYIVKCSNSPVKEYEKNNQDKLAWSHQQMHFYITSAIVNTRLGMGLGLVYVVCYFQMWLTL